MCVFDVAKQAPAPAASAFVLQARSSALFIVPRSPRSSFLLFLFVRSPDTLDCHDYLDMIRRPPTQIPMTDMDVQQVREALARQRAGAAAQPAAPVTPAQAPAQNVPYHHVDEARKKRDAMTREERLGLR